MNPMVQLRLKKKNNIQLNPRCWACKGGNFLFDTNKQHPRIENAFGILDQVLSMNNSKLTCQPVTSIDKWAKTQAQTIDSN